MKKILMFLTMLFAVCITANAQFFSKKIKNDVVGDSGYLRHVPDSITIKRSDGTLFYFYYDLKSKVLFITQQDSLYRKFVNHQMISDSNTIYLDGPIIDPFTLFDKNDLEAKAQKIGIALNGYKVCRLMNWELLDVNIVPKREFIYKPPGQ